MRIAIVGYGKMGHEIERQASAMGVQSAEIFDVEMPLTDLRKDTFDVAIEFTAPESVRPNIEWLARHGKDVVVGTTGWQKHYDVIKALVTRHNIGLIHSPNYSIGVYLFLRLVRAAAQAYQAFPEYDIAVHETHHNQKADAPSGTAIRIGETILSEWMSKTSLFTGALSGKIAPEALQITSSRLGVVAGEHSVAIDSLSDAIELKHTAKNRAGFAIGALRAAEWISGKKGIYSMDDMMADILQRH